MVGNYIFYFAPGKSGVITRFVKTFSCFKTLSKNRFYHWRGGAKQVQFFY
jgi:hypothetical protein